MRTARGSPIISHLFFVDNLILFAEASHQQSFVILNVVDQFCELSRQKVNIAKSKPFVSPNIHDGAREGIEHKIWDTFDEGFRNLS